MINSKCENSIRRKKDVKDGIILSKDQDSTVIIDNKTKPLPSNIHMPKKLNEVSAKIVTKYDKNSKIDLSEDSRLSFLKMSVKMNSYIDKNDFGSFSTGDISGSHYKPLDGKCEINVKSKSEKGSHSKIYNSCKNSSTKVIKCKTRESQFRLSIKSKQALCGNSNDKHMEFNCDINCDEIFPKMHEQINNNSLLVENKKKVMKLDSLLQFLQQMRHTVINRDLSLERFRSISERLYKDKMNIELLMLIDMTVRAQVLEMTRLISTDLCHNKVTPPILVSALLKQYQFLKILSVLYKEMLHEYESTYLAMHNLSFDLINRAYFKRIVTHCPKMKDHISTGNLNAKLDQIINGNMSINERDRIKIDYTLLKSDFQETSRWCDIDNTISNVLNSPNEIVNSLINHSFSSHCHCQGESHVAPEKSSNTYNEILELMAQVSDCGPPVVNGSSPQHCQLNNSTDLESSMTINCGAIFQTQSNSCTSSSNNSNGYNSAVSISSYEDSSDDDNNDDNNDDNSRNAWRRKCDSIDPADLRQSPLHKRWIFHDIDCGSNQEEIKQFDKLYEQYLAENEHLLDRASVSSSSSHMTVPDYLNTLEKADNLQSIIKILMARYKKNIDIQEKIAQHPKTNGSFSKHEDKIAEDIYDMDFEELSEALGVGSTTRENLEEFEKFLDGKPNLQALVANCRIHCNKFYKPTMQHVRSESESSEVVEDSRQTVSGDESFVFPLDCSLTQNGELESSFSETGKMYTYCGCERFGEQNEEFSEAANKSCNVPEKHRVKLHKQNGECPDSSQDNIMGHISSSETGSSGTSTENTSTNKMCNCCKCEMFGEQNVGFLPSIRGTDLRERMRNTLQKRKQCQQKRSTTHASSSFRRQFETLPDVDTLVEFINGPDRPGDVSPQTPDVVRKMPKKSKQNKSKLKKAQKSISECNLCLSTDDTSAKVNSSNNVQVEGVHEFGEDDNLSANVSGTAENQSLQLDDEDRDIYDPVVEDFKKFCSNVVIPKHRKKLPSVVGLLMDQLQRRDCVGVVNECVTPPV